MSVRGVVVPRALSDLVAEGLGGARLHFGAGAPALRADRVLASGRRSFRASADSPTFAMLMTNDETTVALLLGALDSGTRVVSLPIPARNADLQGYVALLRRACESQGVEEIVARDDVAALLSASGLRVRKHSELGGRPVASPSPGGFELVQFSSGSTAQPKAVALDDCALGANVMAIIETLAPRPGDNAVSWLPLSHDMGLIGMLFTSLVSTGPAYVNGAAVVLLDPTTFLRDPGVWLTAISEYRGSITAAPDFGYRMSAQHPVPGALDLASLRCAIIGGETVRATTLHTFEAAFAPNGFTATAFCPAYGLAEIGLAATITPPSEDVRSVAVDGQALADRRFDPVATPDRRVRLVASGPAVPGYEVRCDTTDDIGTISVRGPSVGTDALTGAPFARSDGWFVTGDLGCVVDGWLFVTGRGDDHIVTNGRNVYAPAVEDAVGRVTGAREGRVAAVALPSGDWIVAVEPAAARALTPTQRSALVRDARRAAVAVATASPAEVVILERGRLPMTSSGKLQRRETVRRFLAGEL